VAHPTTSFFEKHCKFMVEKGAVVLYIYGIYGTKHITIISLRPQEIVPTSERR